MRNLAQRSAGAAKEIKTLIIENLANVEESFKWSQQSDSDLKSISSKVSQSHILMGSISEAAREQSQSIHEINSAITSLDQMTQENASMVEETTSASKSVENEVTHVNQLLGFFKLES